MTAPDAVEPMPIFRGMRNQRKATPCLYEVSGTAWLADHTLGEKVFGPLGLIIWIADRAQMLPIAHSLQDQLTCTLTPPIPHLPKA
jgi:2,5-dioxopentanoate dehydrogenase